ncbi:Glu-tRNA(Gln) amidotransferase GatDE subunit D [Candidatus Woesearchaeota archaeon CG10_big_fil_rev_8_21_14_0_10_37_12]|nr:MAG: Glu-tRNA(Gln) amidotransferase GatDE subunit D [Candidatus Woesearchaeota archaeon CG10_big_fil_rev_8_21_14_0_10_37_12]
MAKAGDKVKITTQTKVFEGILLPRPDLLSQDVTVLKLTTGYNIGIETKKIKKIEVTEKYKLPVIKKQKLSKKKGLPTVAILSTGGTISSRVDYRTGGVYADYTAEDFVAMCPELADIANLEAKRIMSLMSEDLLPEDVEKMAKEVIKLLPNVDGIIITHGTDTMHFTAALLSFLLKDLNKPVIVTGSQRSIDRGGSDAFMNLTCAVIAAAKLDAAVVAICMHATIEDKHCQIIRGTKVRKMHTSRRDAFRPINDDAIAHIYPDGKIDIIGENCPRRSNHSTSLRKLGENVGLIYVYPGLDPSMIEYYLKKGVKGIVIAATAFGHINVSDTKYGFLPVLKKAASKGVHIFICSQTIYGSVNPYVYTNLRKLSMGVGAVYLADMLPETAYMKLLVALKQKDPVKFMRENIAGEYNLREINHTFLG